MERLSGIGRGFVAALILVMAVGPARAQADRMRLARLIEVRDGFQLSGDIAGNPVTIRLSGVEPPARSPYGERARAYLAFRLAGKPFGVVRRKVTVDGDWVADVVPAGADRCIQFEMVSKGLAVWNREYAAERTDLAEAQAAAVRDGVGTWGAGLDADPVPPGPRPQRDATETPNAGKSIDFTWLPAAFAGGTVCLLGAAAIMGGPARRLGRRRVQIAGADSGLVKIVGTVRLSGMGASLDGRSSRNIYVRERSWRNMGASWIAEPVAESSVPFLLEDGTGVVWVDGQECRFHCARATRWLNGSEVERWPNVGKPGDLRLERTSIAEGAVVTVLGGFARTPPSIGRWDASTPVDVIEGDMRRVVRRTGRASTFLLGAALACAVATALSVR